MNFSEAVAALDARTNYERSGRMVAPTRERIDALIDLLDHPERGSPTVHITGTNGKTTTARATAEVLRATRLRVAAYTSPHVQSIRERFSYDGMAIPEHDFVEAWRELAPYLAYLDSQGMTITWFEAATALAFIWFADKAVDATVLEVGMGGEWDATNVVDAEVAVLTDVAVDHTELGSSPEETAREKVKIVKPGAIAISARQTPAVEAIVRAHCETTGAELRIAGDSFELEKATLALGGQQCVVRLGNDRYTDLYLPMFGEHAARDAVLGAAAARALTGDVSLDEDIVVEAFGRIKVPGRMEVVHRSPLVILDGAHNAAAADALATAMTASFRWERLWMVVSIMDDKDVKAVLGPLCAIADEVIVTRNTSPRAAALERLADEVRALGKEPTIVADVADAVSVAIERAEDTDAVLVTGSLYTVGHARKKLVRA